MNYKTVKGEASGSFVEKKSEFIGSIAPVKNNDEAIEFINKIKSQNRKARHNVYAYILREQNITRYSDDSEPQGTGGVPVLEVLKKEGLCDVCVVVTRYFGGILLGTGGLTRAYSKGCKLAIEAAEIMDMHLAREITVSLDYNIYGRITLLFNEFDVKLIASNFEKDITLKLLVKSEKVNDFCKKLKEAAFGSINITVGNEIYGNFSQSYE